MDTIEQSNSVFSFTGAHLSLDFVNTVSYWTVEPPYSFSGEYLISYNDLLNWAQQAEVITAAEATALAAQAHQRPAEAEATLVYARELRAVLHTIFADIVYKNALDEDKLGVFNIALAKIMCHARLDKITTGFEWGWQRDTTALDMPLWEVLKAAGDLLTSEYLNQVKICPGKNCAYMFVDISRNHSRYWCDMKTCGNVAKAQRHYHRKRAAKNA